MHLGNSGLLHIKHLGGIVIGNNTWKGRSLMCVGRRDWEEGACTTLPTSPQCQGAAPHPPVLGVPQTARPFAPVPWPHDAERVYLAGVFFACGGGPLTAVKNQAVSVSSFEICKPLCQHAFLDQSSSRGTVKKEAGQQQEQFPTTLSSDHVWSTCTRQGNSKTILNGLHLK